MNRTKKHKVADLVSLHQYYTDIINCMPNMVYWVDKDCVMKGCNRQFAGLLGLKKLTDFRLSPYEKLSKVAQWSNEDMESFRLDDMAVVFSGKPKLNAIVPPIRKGKEVHYLANRHPLFDAAGVLIGVVTVLIDNANIDSKSNLLPELNQKAPVSDYFDHKPCILIVEDNEIAKTVETSLMRSLECEVDAVASGDEALKLFKPGKYDVVMLDIGLGDTSGYVVCKQFRELEKNTKLHVPIIALTSFKAEQVKDDCGYYSMDGVISKPLTSVQASQIIDHFVYHKNVVVTGLFGV